MITKEEREAIDQRHAVVTVSLLDRLIKLFPDTMLWRIDFKTNTFYSFPWRISVDGYGGYEIVFENQTIWSTAWIDDEDVEDISPLLSTLQEKRKQLQERMGQLHFLGNSILDLHRDD